MLAVKERTRRPGFWNLSLGDEMMKPLHACAVEPWWRGGGRRGVVHDDGLGQKRRAVLETPKFVAVKHRGGGGGCPNLDVAFPRACR